MVTDVPLTELFNEEREETSRNNNTSPEETRLKDRREEESGGLVSHRTFIYFLFTFVTCVELHFPISSLCFSGVKEV